MKEVFAQLQELLPNKVFLDDDTREKYDHDASVFVMKPSAVVFPETVEDIQKLVHFVKEHKNLHTHLSLSARAAGTCMSGGSLTESILIVFEKFNKIHKISHEDAVAEPGVYYRDLEHELLKHNLVYPPYPSSKRLCAVGGIVANNAGGEKSLKFGKAEDFVKAVKVILQDGNEYSFHKITKTELAKKMELKTFEGEVYRKIFHLIDKNYDVIQKSKPTVSKNSAGYNIWRVWDKEHFDMTKLFVGSQGTLGIITETTFHLVERKKHHGLMIAYLDNLNNLPEIVKKVLQYNPDSFETFDNYTLRLALKYVTGFAPILKTSVFNTIKQFIPEYLYIIAKGMPKLVLLIEFEDDSVHEINQKLNALSDDLVQFDNLRLKITHKEAERKKYWSIRRESFNLLRHHVKNKYAAPFIDDTCVKPEVYPEFLPELYKIIDESHIQATIAGHIGNGNFHIIPLMDLSDPKERAKIYSVGKKVFALTLKYGGSLTGEHNDGLIRSPYLEQMYGKDMYNLFKEIKHIFDPENIFNPHKKIDVTEAYAAQYLLEENPHQKQAS